MGWRGKGRVGDWHLPVRPPGGPGRLLPGVGERQLPPGAGEHPLLPSLLTAGHKGWADPVQVDLTFEEEKCSADNFWGLFDLFGLASLIRTFFETMPFKPFKYLSTYLCSDCVPSMCYPTEL